MAITSRWSPNPVAKKAPQPVFVYPTSADQVEILLLSDLHLDHPKADRKLLTKHLDQAVARGARVWMNGDVFCAMQSKGDPRGSKASIRPGAQSEVYIDAIVDDAIRFLLPYASIIDYIGEGNHETSITKRIETSLINRLVEGINLRAGTHIQAGGYGGWLVVKFQGENRISWKMKVHHGSGGGGAVSRGIPDFQRLSAMVHGADALWLGHTHDSSEVHAVVETLRHDYTVQLKPIVYIRTSTYKEEYGIGHGGWHVERLAPPKVLGGRWLIVERRRDSCRGLHVVAWTTHAT